LVVFLVDFFTGILFHLLLSCLLRAIGDSLHGISKRNVPHLIASDRTHVPTVLIVTESEPKTTECA
jgi:hypothetical protein